MREDGKDLYKFSAGGTVIVYPTARLFEEAAYIAYYFHWTHDDIMALSHLDRQEWCRRITGINKQLNKTPGNIFEL